MSMSGDDHESGKSLRDRMEEAIAAQKTMADELHAYKVRDVLSEKGFSFVKPEDLAGVSLDQVETRAAAIHGERVELQKSLLKDALTKQGVAEDDLEAMVSDLLSEKQSESPEAEAARRAQSVGRVEGGPVPRINPAQLEGVDAIRAHFEQQGKKK